MRVCHHTVLCACVGMEMARLAEDLNYDREIILRIWFCNKRQVLKNTVHQLPKPQTLADVSIPPFVPPSLRSQKHTFYPFRIGKEGYASTRKALILRKAQNLCSM